MPQPDYNTPTSLGSLELREKANNEFIGQDIDYTPGRCSEVQLVAIDDFALTRVDFIKFDVEGMELDVLDGAQATIARCMPMMLIEIIKSDLDQLRNRLVGMSYTLFPMGMNVLAVHDSDPMIKNIRVQRRPA